MTKKLALAALTTVLANGVCAYEAGDFFVRVGAAMVDPDSSSSGLALPVLGVPAIPGTELEVDDDTQLGLTLTYMFTDKIGLELLAASPFKHNIKARLDGFQADLSVPVGDVKHLPPTLSVVYYPLSGSSAGWQPYIGLGVNYTYFFDENVDPDLEALTGFLAQEISDIGDGSPVALSMNIDDSFGIAAEAGFDLPLNDTWHVNASVRWIDIDTEASIDSALGETIRVDSIHIDPWVYQVNVGYKF